MCVCVCVCVCVRVRMCVMPSKTLDIKRCIFISNVTYQL